jgi:hypothetical protein
MADAPCLLNYRIHSWSSFSASFRPQNILVDTPSDLSSRWSSQTTSESQSLKDRPWLVLKLDRTAILRSFTFGKCSKSHPCNVKDLRILVPDLRVALLWR